MRKYLVIFERSLDGWSAYAPDLPGCVAFGDNKEEVEELIYNGIELHLKGMIEDGEQFPEHNTEAMTMTFDEYNVSTVS